MIPTTTPNLSRLVLDTNVVLDCLVFNDPATRELISAIEARRVAALVNPHTLEELERVLSYPQCRLAVTEQQQVLQRYLNATTPAPMPDGFARDDLRLPPGFPRCRDWDDQPFLALAYHAKADGLVTKDKAVLELRKKMQKFGVAVLAPTDITEF